MINTSRANIRQQQQQQNAISDLRNWERLTPFLKVN